MDQRVIVLGAGISGLSLAWKLALRGVAVDLLERNSFVGGLAGTIREEGHCLDFGPHSFFSEDLEILDTVRKLFDSPLTPISRHVKFYYKGKYLDYPITAGSVLFQMGFLSGIRASLSFLKSRMTPIEKSVRIEEDQSVEDWAIANFGEHLYRTFFKPYTEQFWMTPCTELSARTIPSHTRMSFVKTLALLLQRQVAKEGLSLIERERLPTYYPRTGYGEIAERIAQKVEEVGGKIHLNCPVTEIVRLPEDRLRVTYTHNGQREEIEGSRVVSTLPLNLLIKMLRPTPPSEVLSSAEKIDYRPLVMLGMVTEKQNVLGASYIYILDRPYYRITETNKFSPATSPPGDNIVAVEIPCLRGSPTWNATKEELFEKCIGSLSRDGILSRKEVKRLLLVKTPYAYPIYRKGYAKHLGQLMGFVQQCPGLETLGRTGEFMYMDLDKCMRRAFDLAERLRNGTHE